MTDDRAVVVGPPEGPEPGGNLVPAGPAATLFHTSDPAEVIAVAQQVAGVLKTVVVANGMTQRIGTSDHVKIEGWQTLGAMLGVSAHTVWSRPIDNGWEAKAEARTVTGNVVGAAEAMCTRQERNWAGSDDYAIRSMAQTRAHAKALAAPLRFVMTLAGQSGTPAEEIPEEPPVAKASRELQAQVADMLAMFLEGDQAAIEACTNRLLQQFGGVLPVAPCQAIVIVGRAVREQLAANLERHETP